MLCYVGIKFEAIHVDSRLNEVQCGDKRCTWRIPLDVN